MKKLLTLLMAVIMISSSACSGGATQIETTPTQSNFDDNDISSATAQTETSTTTVDNSNAGEVMYKGVPVAQFYNCTTIDDIAEIMGKPLSEEHYGAGSDYSYDDIRFFFDNYVGGLYSISCDNPGAFEINGVVLDTNRAGLIEIFGNPAKEGWNEWNEELYEIIYNFEDYDISFAFDAPDGKVNYFNFIGILDDDLDNGDNYSGESGFSRSDYFTGIGYTDLIRYPDKYVDNKVYFDRWEIVSIATEKMYVLQRGSNYMYLDDTSNTEGPNGMIGDKLLIYGRFTGNENVVLYGQIPFIESDLTINYSVSPDNTIWAKGLVEMLNINSYAYSSDNRYFRDNYVSLIYKVGSRDFSTIPYLIGPCDLKRAEQDGAEFYVDGRPIHGNIVTYNGLGVTGSNGDINNLPMEVIPDHYYRINGYVKFQPYEILNYIYMDIESMELYE